MRKRGLRIDVMLNEIEYKKLMDDVEREKTSYSDYVRKLIMKAELKEKPDYEFYNVMKELTKIGINLNQLAKKANTLNFIDKDDCFFIHYASDGFYNGSSPAPKISCIAIFSESLKVIRVFSINTYIQSHNIENSEKFLLLPRGY